MGSHVPSLSLSALCFVLQPRSAPSFLVRPPPPLRNPSDLLALVRPVFASRTSPATVSCLYQERAEQLWTVYYTETQRSCYHGQTCTATARGRKCTEGMRETMHIVEGALLPIWKLLMDNKWAPPPPRPLPCAQDPWHYQLILLRHAGV